MTHFLLISIVCWNFTSYSDLYYKKLNSFISYRDEKVVSRAVELNEQLERVLRRHDSLLAGRTMSTSNHIDHEQEEEEEEEEAEQLFRRYACYMCIG